MSDEYPDWLVEYEKRDAARAAWSSFGDEETPPSVDHTVPAAPLQLSDVDEAGVRFKAAQDKLRASGLSDEQLQKHWDAWNITDPVIDRSKLIVEKDGRTKVIPESSKQIAESKGWKVTGAKERLVLRNPQGELRYIPNDDAAIEAAKAKFGYAPLSKSAEHKKDLRAELERRGIGQADIALNDLARSATQGLVEIEGLDNTNPLPAPDYRPAQAGFGQQADTDVAYALAGMEPPLRPSIEDKFREKYGENWADEYNKEQEARTHRRELVGTLREDNPWTSYLAGIAGMVVGPEAQAVAWAKVGQLVEKATLKKLAQHGVRDVATAAAVADTAAGVMANLPIKQAVAAEIAAKTAGIAAENAAFQILGIPGRLTERAASGEPLGLDALWDEVKGLGLAIGTGAAFGPVAGAASANSALRAVERTEAKISHVLDVDARTVADTKAVREAAKVIEQGREARSVLASEEEAIIDRAIETTSKKEWLPLSREEVSAIVDMTAEQAAAFDEIMPLSPHRMPEQKPKGPSAGFSRKQDDIDELINHGKTRYDADGQMLEAKGYGPEATMRKDFARMSDEQVSEIKKMLDADERPRPQPRADSDIAQGETAPVRDQQPLPEGSADTVQDAQASPPRYPEGPLVDAEGGLQAIVDHEQSKAPAGDIRGDMDAARAKLESEIPPEVTAAKEWMDRYVKGNLVKYTRQHVLQIAATAGRERLYTQAVTKALRDGMIDHVDLRKFFGSNAAESKAMIRRMKADGIITGKPVLVTSGPKKGRKLYKTDIDSPYIKSELDRIGKVYEDLRDDRGEVVMNSMGKPRRAIVMPHRLEGAVDAWLDSAPSRSGKTRAQLDELKAPGKYNGAAGEAVADPGLWGAWRGDSRGAMPESHLGAQGRVYEDLGESAEKFPKIFKAYRELKGEEIARRQALGVVSSGEAAIRKNLDKALIDSGALDARNRQELLASANRATKLLEERGHTEEAIALNEQLQKIVELEMKIKSARRGSFARKGRSVFLRADWERVPAVGPGPDFAEIEQGTQPRSAVPARAVHRMNDEIMKGRSSSGIDERIRQNEAGQDLAQQRLASRKHEAAQTLVEEGWGERDPAQSHMEYNEIDLADKPAESGLLDHLVLAGRRIERAIKPLRQEAIGDAAYGIGAAASDKMVSNPLHLGLFAKIGMRRFAARQVYKLWRMLADNTHVQKKVHKWRKGIIDAISEGAGAVGDLPWHSAFSSATSRLLLKDEDEKKLPHSDGSSLGEQIRYLLDEIHGMVADPEGMGRKLFEHYQPVRVRNGEDAERLERAHEQKIMFLDKRLPRNPRPANPLAPHTDLWRPNEQEAAAAANYVLAVDDPVGAITRAMRAGHVASETIETLRELHPELLDQARDWVMEALGDSVGELPIEKRRIISRIFDMPALEPYTSSEFNQDVAQFFAAQAEEEQARNDERQGGASNRKKLGLKVATAGTPAGRQRG